VNRQTWAGQTSLLVHPASLYVGIRTPRTFVQKNEKIEVESIVSDIDGKLVAGRDAEIKAVLKDWQFDKGEWKEVTVDEQFCTVKSAESPQKCTFVAKNGGRYIVTATVMDDRERFNESEITIWVPGGKQPPKRNVEQEEVQIIPSKKDFAPGDIAEMLVISPFTPAEGVLTLRRDGIVKTERFSMKDSSVTLKIRLKKSICRISTPRLILSDPQRARTIRARSIRNFRIVRPMRAEALTLPSRRLRESWMFLQNPRRKRLLLAAKRKSISRSRTITVSRSPTAR
jgi:uncharacterized protein YfaS (alpha-2-macroglobulin family)